MCRSQRACDRTFVFAAFFAATHYLSTTSLLVMHLAAQDILKAIETDDENISCDISSCLFLFVSGDAEEVCQAVLGRHVKDVPGDWKSVGA